MQKIIPVGSRLVPDEATKVFTGQIFDVYQYQQELYDGSFGTFEMLRRPDTTSAICIVDDKIIVIEDEQPHRKMVIALPGGRTEPTDISVLDALKREVREETGHVFDSWELLEVSQPHEKMEWFIYCYLAFDAGEKIAAHVDAGEKIKVNYYTLDQVKELANNGEPRFAPYKKFFDACKTVQDLKNLPQFQGQEVNR